MTFEQQREVVSDSLAWRASQENLFIHRLLSTDYVPGHAWTPKCGAGDKVDTAPVLQSYEIPVIEGVSA